MQVISGKYRARKLISIEDEGTRPTLAKVKESMFAMIDDKIYDSVVLDLFAGSGSLGIEAISRGAQKVYFVDNNRKVKAILEKNLRNIKEPFEIVIDDFSKALDLFAKKHLKFDIVLIDAPYKSDFGGQSLEILAEKQLLNDNATIVYEQERINCLQNVRKCYKIIKTKTHGIANISILEYTRE